MRARSVQSLHGWGTHERTRARTCSVDVSCRIELTCPAQSGVSKGRHCVSARAWAPRLGRDPISAAPTHSRVSTNYSQAAAQLAPEDTQPLPPIQINDRGVMIGRGGDDSESAMI